MFIYMFIYYNVYFYLMVKSIYFQYEYKYFLIIHFINYHFQPMAETTSEKKYFGWKSYSTHQGYCGHKARDISYLPKTLTYLVREKVKCLPGYPNKVHFN